MFPTHAKLASNFAIFTPSAGFKARRAQKAKKRKIFLNVNHSKGFIPSPGLCHYSISY